MILNVDKNRIRHCIKNFTPLKYWQERGLLPWAVSIWWKQCNCEHEKHLNQTCLRKILILHTSRKPAAVFPWWPNTFLIVRSRTEKAHGRNVIFERPKKAPYCSLYSIPEARQKDKRIKIHWKESDLCVLEASKIKETCWSNGLKTI
jgi:hypothetical protein